MIPLIWVSGFQVRPALWFTHRNRVQPSVCAPFPDIGWRCRCVVFWSRCGLVLQWWQTPGANAFLVGAIDRLLEENQEALFAAGVSTNSAELKLREAAEKVKLWAECFMQPVELDGMEDSGHHHPEQQRENEQSHRHRPPHQPQPGVAGRGGGGGNGRVAPEHGVVGGPMACMDGVRFGNGNPNGTAYAGGSGKGHFENRVCVVHFSWRACNRPGCVEGNLEQKLRPGQPIFLFVWVCEVSKTSKMDILSSPWM